MKAERMTENKIVNAAYRVISDIVGNMYEYSDDNPTSDNNRIATLGEITGVLKLVDELRGNEDETE